MSPAAIPQLFTSLASSKASEKLAASKELRDLSARDPEALYPHFDFFAGLLGHPNNVLKWNAILTVAHLARADREHRIESLLDAYLAPITGPAMITAANIIKGAALIARARPELGSRIANGILRVERAKYTTPECLNIAIGHALTALASMGPVLDPGLVRAFARRHLDNPRRATAAKARRIAA